MSAQGDLLLFFGAAMDCAGECCLVISCSNGRGGLDDCEGVGPDDCDGFVSSVCCSCGGGGGKSGGEKSHSLIVSCCGWFERCPVKI